MRNTPTSKYGSLKKREDGRCVVIFERRLSHPVDKVWQAIIDPAHLAKWFPGMKMESRLGGAFSITFGGECDGSVHVSGTVSVFEPPHRLQLGSMRYELQSQGNDTLLRFSDVLEFKGERSNEDIANSVLGGWHRYLDQLEDSLATNTEAGRHEEPDYSAFPVEGREVVIGAPRQE